ncbi:hypothetical protein WR25_16298 [Diploscapter pachys]|uniref:Uncharacterized protein n=1 Tax=Diploscapter pachys TaxID=2018661 RepID=A0A2A2KIS7_9BILA|nr:hypothetical protein WR25_16298 [Diploscapter pachys]
MKLLILLAAVIAIATACSVQGRTYKNGETWVSNNSFKMKCIIDNNGGWKTDIISCLTPKQRKEFPVGGKVREDNYMYECQRASGSCKWKTKVVACITPKQRTEIPTGSKAIEGSIDLMVVVTRSASRSSNRSTDDEAESGDERGSDRRGEGRLNEAREVQRMETILEEDKTNGEEEEEAGKTAEGWKDIIEKAEFSEDLLNEILKEKLFHRPKKFIQPTKALQNIAEGFVLFLHSDSVHEPKIIKSLSNDIFGRADFLQHIKDPLIVLMKSLTYESVTSAWNVLNFVKTIDKNAKPKLLFADLEESMFKDKERTKRLKPSKVWGKIWDELWTTFLCETKIPKELLIKLLPFVTENVLETFKEPFRTADFFFRSFKYGGIYAILSLAAIFKLIVVHNFEYPDFYKEVYALTTPFVLYSDYKETFIRLIDSFLSSTHIPLYIVASFIKRLSRNLLVAPLEAQEPILGLLRNFVIRHPIASQLMHRNVPEKFDSDPFNNEEPDLSKTNALNSSLWEIKTLQNHWHPDVGRRAKFVDRQPEKVESFVRFRTSEQLWENLAAKKYGKAKSSAEEQFRKSQEGEQGENEDELNEKEEIKEPPKKKKKGGKFAAKNAFEDDEIKYRKEAPTAGFLFGSLNSNA